ncbi:hypothetical protein HYS94_01445 [Candidatus Daviesbacteria bacterium]|nr:hypothetical protein [Candidatus Daviesbacteria bacterium]
MFYSLKAKILLGVYIFLLLSIPIGAYLASQQQIFKTGAKSAKEAPKKPATATPSASVSDSSDLSKGAGSKLQFETSSTPTPSPREEPSSSIDTSYGPTLTFKVNLEGRPAGNQAARMFVGIIEGALTINPDYLLIFNFDIPESGESDELSLAGLDTNKNYTAILKGPAQIATSSAFLMSPALTKLNDGNALTLLSGDLNEDNVINSADFSLAQSLLGSKSGSANWNDNADFNKDGVINSLDLGYILKNFGKTGDSGAWTSPIPSATSSASLNQPATGGNPSGYWLWIPGL